MYGNSSSKDKVAVVFKNGENEYKTYSSDNGTFNLDLPSGLYEVNIKFYNDIEVHIHKSIKVTDESKLFSFDLKDIDSHIVMLNCPQIEELPIKIENEPKVLDKVILRSTTPEREHINKRN